MQVVELKIEDDYIDSVLNILKSLKKDMIKEINIKHSIEDNRNDNLKEFYSLIRKGNNKIILTTNSAINTDEMIDFDTKKNVYYEN